MDAHFESALSEKRQFISTLSHAKEHQREVLRSIIRANQETVFGREHSFASVTDIDSYRNAVPIRAYDALEGWMQRALQGEERVLTEAPPVIFLKTSGTSREPKKVPAVKAYFDHLQKLPKMYDANLIEYWPEIAEHPSSMLSLTRAPKPFTEHTRAGVPIHSLSEMPDASAPHELPAFVRSPWHSPPAHLIDPHRLYYYLRLSLEADIRIVSCLHPSRLQSFVQLLQDSAPRLIEEIANGTLFDAPYTKPNKKRASDLEFLLLEHGVLTPRLVWPNLRVVCCWVGGRARHYIEKAMKDYCDEVVETSITSTEAGHATMIIDRAPGGVLAIDNNFWEFIPASEAESFGPSQPTLLFDQLEVGCEYVAVISSSSGLYRYNTQDILKVVGTYEGVPRLQFVARLGIVDLAGEKVTERQIISAIEDSLESASIHLTAYACAPSEGTLAKYVAIFEGPVPVEARDALTKDIDARLRAQNWLYHRKRSIGDLGSIELMVVSEGSFERYRRERIEEGAMATQLKDRILHSDDHMLRFIENQ